MKKKLTLTTITYLFLTMNLLFANQIDDKQIDGKNQILKIGVLVPLTGEFGEIGQSILNSIKLATFSLEQKNIEVYPKNSGGDPNIAFEAASEFQEMGITIVIGPIFHQSLQKLDQFEKITFFSLTNKTHWLPKNVVAFGININSQLNTIKKYLKKNNFSKTILLIPKNEFENEIKESVDKKEFSSFKIITYDTDPKKITSEIEKITSYDQRKRNLNRRLKILEKSDLYKDKKEYERLKKKYTLGNINFDSVVIADFGENLKSVLTSFKYSDVTDDKVVFFTINQWFDESLFEEDAMENLLFPSIDYQNFYEYKKKYFKTFNKKASEISLLAHDLLGLVYYLWQEKKDQTNMGKLLSKINFKGLHSKFSFKNNQSYQNLNIYRISEKTFNKIN